jgi:hypothetical protein
MSKVYKIEGELVAYGASQSITNQGTIYDYAQFRTATGRVNVDALVVTNNIDPVFSVNTSGTFYITKTRNRAFLLAATVNGENFDARQTLKKVVKMGVPNLLIDLAIYAALAMLVIGIVDPKYLAGSAIFFIGFGPFWLIKRAATPRIPQGDFNGLWATNAVPLTS